MQKKIKKRLVKYLTSYIIHTSNKTTEIDMSTLYFSEINTKNIKTSDTELMTVRYGCSVMGEINKYDSNKFAFKLNGSDVWTFVKYNSAKEIKKQLLQLRK